MVAQLRVSPFNATDRLPDPASHGLARPLGGIQADPLPPAETHRCAQLAEKELPLPARPRLSLRVVGRLGVGELLVQISQALPVLLAGLEVEQWPSTGLDSEPGLDCTPLPWAPTLRPSVRREVDSRHLASRGDQQSRDVSQPLAVPEADDPASVA